LQVFHTVAPIYHERLRGKRSEVTNVTRAEVVNMYVLTNSNVVTDRQRTWIVTKEAKSDGSIVSDLHASVP
jgi:hypothetical protein